MTPGQALRFSVPAARRSPDDARAVGALFVLAAILCFSGLDTTSKVIHAVPVVMLVWCRYVVQTAVTAATELPRHGRALLHTQRPGLHVLRGALILATSICTFLSLRYMPVGEFTAVLMLTPLLLIVISALAFDEAVSRLRWALIALTFGGALLVVKPGAGLLTPAVLMPLLALALNTAFHLATSRLARTEDVGTMQFYTGCTGALLSTLALPFAWTPLGSWTTWALLGLVCVLSTAGHRMLIVGYAKAGVATLTPLLFAQIASSMLLGWLVFGHVPDRWALGGICLIALGGATCTWLSTRGRAPVRDLAALENATMEH